MDTEGARCFQLPTSPKLYCALARVTNPGAQDGSALHQHTLLHRYISAKLHDVMPFLPDLDGVQVYIRVDMTERETEDLHSG